MEYTHLSAGFALLVLFTYLLRKNATKSNLLHQLLRIDTIVGIGAGFYLIVTYLNAIFFSSATACKTEERGQIQFKF